ncbi:Wadjet anti-phage system protein JetD domain-containing protein [Niabella hirudinis]|uniref:Wadjet anti-phage system protein JetD domain-containing protein n=1 Tax=Niabella hirudinis TaxID=1285929 RepID=UPI003EBA3CA6
MTELYLLQLERLYKKYLKDVIAGAAFDPIDLRGGKQKPATAVELHQAIAQFRSREKTAQTAGWTIHWEDWDSRRLGRQAWPGKIVVEEENDYLYLLQKDREAAVFKLLVEQLLSWQPGIQPFLLANPEKILQLKDDWPGIMRVVDYLLLHDVRNHYIRSIPVPVHTKFIEIHKQTVASLLAMLRPGCYMAGDTLEQMLELKTKKKLYTLRWLDSGLAAQYMHGIGVAGVSIETLQQVSWRLKEIWLVENETNLYLLPEREGALVIFSKGYAANKIKDVPLFHQADLYYWGDLDEDGYRMLQLMRNQYANLKSIFMDSSTLLAHETEIGGQGHPYKITDLELLTEEERAAFNILKYHGGRLEQEKIRQDFIRNRLLIM